MTLLRRLLPDPADLGDPAGADAEVVRDVLAELYAYPDPVPPRGWVRANMVATLDGSASGPDGLSGSISGPADRAVFSVLRGLADVVLVGAGTARAEGYRVPAAKPAFAARRARLGQPPAPALAVLSRSGVLPDTLTRPPAGSPAGSSAGSSTGSSVATAHGEVLVLQGGLRQAVAELAGRGLRRILLEGGPGVLGQAVTAGLLDELCLSLSPLLVGGSGPRIIDGASASARLRVSHLLDGDGLLLGRWLVERTSSAESAPPSA